MTCNIELTRNAGARGTIDTIRQAGKSSCSLPDVILDTHTAGLLLMSSWMTVVIGTARRPSMGIATLMPVLFVHALT